MSVIKFSQLGTTHGIMHKSASLISHSLRLKAACQIINLYSDDDLPSQSR